MGFGPPYSSGAGTKLCPCPSHGQVLIDSKVPGRGWEGLGQVENTEHGLPPLNVQVWRLPYPPPSHCRCPRTEVTGDSAGTYLQAAEGGKEVVKAQSVAVDGQESQQPGGCDEQQQEEGRPQHGTVGRTIRIMAGCLSVRPPTHKPIPSLASTRD